MRSTSCRSPSADGHGCSTRLLAHGTSGLLTQLSPQLKVRLRPAHLTSARITLLRLLLPSGNSGVFSRHRSNCQCNFKGNIIVGDYANGNISRQAKCFEDNGIAQRWLRSWRALPTGQNNLKRAANHSLQLECRRRWLNNRPGSDPQAMLRWSDDGGHMVQRTLGVYGQDWRNWHPCHVAPASGMTLKLRDRVYELSGSDPVRIY